MEGQGPKKQVRQRYFVPREIRVSITLLVLWSILATAAFIFFMKALSGVLEYHSVFAAVLILAGYVVIVVALTVVFSNRIIGPFKRLNFELDKVVAGDFKRRLEVRKKDDMAVRNFVDHINSVIDRLEETRHQKEEYLVRLVTELSKVLSEMERGALSGDALRGRLSTLQEEAGALLEGKQTGV